MSSDSIFQIAFEDFGLEQILVIFMVGTSLLLVAIAFERLFTLFRVRLSVRAARKVVAAAQAGSLQNGRDACDLLKGPARPVFQQSLDRALGTVRGDPAKAILREQRRLRAAMKSRTWLLATAGALMPFVGLFGTVTGVMSAFGAIGESGQGGFAIVSVGISQALIATAVGIVVALEGVFLFNLLQSISQRLSHELAMLADELLERIEVEGRPHAGDPQ